MGADISLWLCSTSFEISDNDGGIKLMGGLIHYEVSHVGMHATLHLYLRFCRWPNKEGLSTRDHLLELFKSSHRNATLFIKTGVFSEPTIVMHPEESRDVAISTIYEHHEAGSLKEALETMARQWVGLFRGFFR